MNEIQDLILTKKELFRNQIRKQKMNELLTEKRIKLMNQNQNSNNLQEDLLILFKNFNPLFANMEFSQIYQIINEEFKQLLIFDQIDEKNLLRYIQMYRQLVTLFASNQGVQCVEQGINYMISNKIYLNVGQFLDQKYDQYQSIQVEVSWYFQNIFCLTNTPYKVDDISQIVSNLQRLITNLNVDVAQQSMLALHNLILDSNIFKIYLIQNNFIEQVSHHINEVKVSMKFKKEVSLLMHTLLEQNQQLSQEQTQLTYFLLNSICKNFSDKNFQIIIETINKLDNHKNTNLLFYLKFVHQVIQRIQDIKDPQLLWSNLVFINNIAMVEDNQIIYVNLIINKNDFDLFYQKLIDLRILDILDDLIIHHSTNIRFICCLIISNMILSDKFIIQSIFDKLFVKMINSFSVDTLKVRIELCICFCNAFINCDKDQIQVMNQTGVIKMFIQMLEFKSETLMIKQILDTFKFLFNQNYPIDQDSQYQLKFQLLELQTHPNLNIYELAVQILEQNYIDIE